MIDEIDIFVAFWTCISLFFAIVWNKKTMSDAVIKTMFALMTAWGFSLLPIWS